MAEFPEARAVPDRLEQRPYESPQVTPLGPWERRTLVISVPLGPGSAGLNLGERDAR